MRAGKSRRLAIAGAILMIAVTGAACGDDGPNPVTVASPSPSPAPSVVSPVTGLVIEIESDGFDKVTSFVLKSGDETYEIFIAKDVDYGFPLSHLNAHRVGAEPVVVELEQRNGRLVALSIEDA